MALGQHRCLAVETQQHRKGDLMSRSHLFAVLLLSALPAWAEPASQQSKDQLNWDIFQKLYPPRALAAHEQGAVGFTVTLDSKGVVTGCHVTHSSGHPLLDEETCKLITMNAQFNPDPNVSASQTRTHEGLIAWKLPAWATALQPPKPVVAAAAPEPLVCKKALRAGSLASFERTCLTPRQWATQSDDMKQPYADMQGTKGSSSSICVGSMGIDVGPGKARDC
jgi:protein TonB